MEEITPRMFLAWVGTGRHTEDFEICAEWFHKETRMLAPGKSQAAACCGSPSDDERGKVHREWAKETTLRVAKYAKELMQERATCSCCY